jgi:hypothetical protein
MRKMSWKLSRNFQQVQMVAAKKMSNLADCDHSVNKATRLTTKAVAPSLNLWPLWRLKEKKLRNLVLGALA